MANPSPEPQKQQPEIFRKITVKAIKLPPGQRSSTKKLPRYDDLVIPRSYWYWTAGMAAAALALGLLVGRFLLG
jgi:hypothetical protein